MATWANAGRLTTMRCNLTLGAARRGSLKRVGFPIGLVHPDLSCSVLIGTFLIFRDFPGFGGIVPIGPLPLIKAPTGISWKGPRHNRDLSRKKWGTPPLFENPLA